MSIFHFPSVSVYFPTTSGLSQLLKCPDHNIAAIGTHLHILDRLISLRRAAYNKEDSNRGGYFWFYWHGMPQGGNLLKFKSKKWSTMEDDDSSFADSLEQKRVMCSNWLDWLGFPIWIRTSASHKHHQLWFWSLLQYVGEMRIDFARETTIWMLRFVSHPLHPIIVFTANDNIAIYLHLNLAIQRWMHWW